VGKLVVVSANFKRSAYYPEILAQQGQVTAEAAETMKQTPMYQMYASIPPRREDWPRLLAKLGEAMANDFAPWSSLGLSAAASETGMVSRTTRSAARPRCRSTVIPFLDAR
jgi:hypothetical protein